MRTIDRRSAGAALTGVLLLATLGGGTALADDTTLRVAMGSPGEAGIRVFDAIAADFEASHPGVDVEMNYQQDDLYEQIGLQQLLAGRNAPDIYFEWTGARMAQRAADGYAADLTEAATSGPLAPLFAISRNFTPAFGLTVTAGISYFEYMCRYSFISPAMNSRMPMNPTAPFENASW